MHLTWTRSRSQPPPPRAMLIQLNYFNNENTPYHLTLRGALFAAPPCKNILGGAHMRHVLSSNKNQIAVVLTEGNALYTSAPRYENEQEKQKESSSCYSYYGSTPQINAIERGVRVICSIEIPFTL